MIQGDLTSLADALGTKSDGAILGVEMDDAARYGSLEFDTERRLTQFAEKRPGAGVINAGVYLLRASTLERFPAKRPLSFEVDVFPELIAGGGEFKVATVRTPFLDIGTPESLAQAESFVTSLKTSTHIESQAQKRV